LEGQGSQGHVSQGQGSQGQGSCGYHNHNQKIPGDPRSTLNPKPYAGLTGYLKVLEILRALLHTTLQFREEDVASSRRCSTIPNSRMGHDKEQDADGDKQGHAHGDKLPPLGCAQRSAHRGAPRASGVAGTFGLPTHLVLGAQALSEEGRRSLFMDRISMQDVQDAVSSLDLSVLYGEVHGRRRAVP
jgi:hypothetical protein